jgi:hypothetical protein
MTARAALSKLASSHLPQVAMHAVASTIASPESADREPAADTRGGEGQRTTLRFDAGAARPATISREPAGRPDAQRRSQLERDLERVQGALGAEQATFGHQVNWMLLSQGLFLNAFLLLLIVGWSTPLPGKRLLLAGLAIVGVALAMFVTMALRGARETLRGLKDRRRDLEEQLQKEFGRTPVFAPGAGVAALGGAATRLLPVAFVAGWIALSLYTLALPLGSNASGDARAAAPAASPQASRPAARPRTAAPAGQAGGEQLPPGTDPTTPTEPAAAPAPKRSQFRP